MIRLMWCSEVYKHCVMFNYLNYGHLYKYYFFMILKKIFQGLERWLCS